MKLKKIFITAFTTAVVFGCGAQQINPITRAMLQGYTEILKENPKDYQTLYERAAQYYTLSQYDNALNDLTRAVEYTPAKEKELRLQEFSLMSDVAIEMKNYELALKAIDEALKIQPDNYANVYKKGNICLYLKLPEEGYKAFASMQALKSRSQEAYFGMAKCRIMQGLIYDAQDLIKEAENADPSNYLTYCRIGDLYQDMDQPENAATNYVLAFMLAKDSTRPLESLMELAQKNYPAVEMALNFAIEKSDNKVPLLFLKGNIALQSGHYREAESALSQLASISDGQVAGVYSALAEARMALNQLNGAQEAIDNALMLRPEGYYYVQKARIENALGNYKEALDNANRGMASADSSLEALKEKAKALINMKNGDAALATLNEAVITSPEDGEALLLRAYVNETLLGNGKAAVGDFNRIILLDAETPNAKALKALAQAKSGKKLDGDTTIEEALMSQSPVTPKDLYAAAIYYSQTGSLEKGAEIIEKAIYEGYQDEYNLKSNMSPWQNISPIRHLLK